MMIVILEDNIDRQAAMRACLADRFYTFETHFFDDAREMIRFLDEHLADTLAISLDHDLELKPGRSDRLIDPGTGRMVADFLATKSPSCPVVIATTNAPAAEGMKCVLRDAGWKTRRVVPFDDMQWIETEWFPTLRRAIVGPVRRR
jgi:CheY-like chemotaxis protein